MGDVRVELRQLAQTPTSEGVVRQHRVLVDRPEAKGGLDRGPMGGEYLLVALGGCFISNLIAAARARDVVLSDLAVTVKGALAAAPPRVDAITLLVQATGADEPTIDKLIEIAERGCIVHNTLKGSVRLEIRRAAAARG